MNEHTKGPWTVCGGYTPSYAAINSVDGYIVFGMADRIDHKEHGKPIKAPSFDAQRANVRLMAAAPDLLAACRAAFERLKAEGDPFVGDDWELGHRLSAAIGKATDPEYPR